MCIYARPAVPMLGSLSVSLYKCLLLFCKLYGWERLCLCLLTLNCFLHPVVNYSPYILALIISLSPSQAVSYNNHRERERGQGWKWVQLIRNSFCGRRVTEPQGVRRGASQWPCSAAHSPGCQPALHRWRLELSCQGRASVIIHWNITSRMHIGSKVQKCSLSTG